MWGLDSGLADLVVVRAGPVHNVEPNGADSSSAVAVPVPVVDTLPINPGVGALVLVVHKAIGVNEAGPSQLVLGEFGRLENRHTTLVCNDDAMMIPDFTSFLAFP